MDIILKYLSENYMDVAAASIGLLYLYLEYKASIWMWMASIVMAVFFVYIFYASQLYANMAIYIYFGGASIYGWIAWRNQNRNKETGEHILLRLPRTQIKRIALLIMISFICIASILYVATSYQIVVSSLDAFITALSIVALWMASRKWAEQWCLLIPANLLSSILLYMQGEPASALMFLIYFVVSIFGYFNWVKMARVHTKQ